MSNLAYIPGGYFALSLALTRPYHSTLRDGTWMILALFLGWSGRFCSQRYLIGLEY